MRTRRRASQAVQVDRRPSRVRLVGPVVVILGLIAALVTFVVTPWAGEPQPEVDVALTVLDRSATAAGFPPPPPTPPATPIARRPVVALDAGHGGPDDDLPRADRSGRLLPWYREGDNSGAIFRSNGGSELREKDLTLRLALATADLLEAEDVLVVVTRREDVPVNLERRDLNEDGKLDLVDELLARIDLINRSQADVLVSIHLNAHPSPSMRGTYANYASGRPFTRESIRLAVTLHQQVLRGIRELSPGAVDRGVEDDVEDDPTGRHLLLLGSRTARAPFETTMPGALIEPLFMTNPEDVELLRRADLLDAVARSLADGILEYLRES